MMYEICMEELIGMLVFSVGISCVSPLCLQYRIFNLLVNLPCSSSIVAMVIVA